MDVAAVEPSLPAALVILDAAARQMLIDGVGEWRDARRTTSGPGAWREPSARFVRRQGARRHAVHASSSSVTAVALADPRRESPLESFSFGQMVLHGLPLPKLQVRIRTARGDVYPDFLWEEAMVIGEADGMVKYRTPEDLKRREVAAGGPRGVGLPGGSLGRP